MSTAIRHVRPRLLDDALSYLQQDRFQIMAGGTDFYPALGDTRPKSPVLDITLIDELRGLTVSDAGLTIGALSTWSDIVKANLPAAFRALKLAALEIGSVQIQNRATIAGNLCNASPAADGVPPLLITDASVNLASGSGTRSLPLIDFIQGNRKTLKKTNEIVTSVSIPAAACVGSSDFLKLGARKYLVISIAMVATRVVVEEGIVTSCAISVGSCSEVARRLDNIESRLLGEPANEATVCAKVNDELKQLDPITDVRSSAVYRKQAAATLVRRSLIRCMTADRDSGMVNT